MLSPSRTIVVSLLALSALGLVLGLGTDVGLFGWTFALLVLLYLGVAGIARVVRRSGASGTPA